MDSKKALDKGQTEKQPHAQIEGVRGGGIQQRTGRKMLGDSLVDTRPQNTKRILYIKREPSSTKEKSN